MKYSMSTILQPRASTHVIYDPRGTILGTIAGPNVGRIRVDAHFANVADEKTDGTDEKTDVIVYDIKIGKNSQLCSAASFESSLLEQMDLVTEPLASETQILSVYVHNPHDRHVHVYFRFEDVPPRGAHLKNPRRLPLGVMEESMMTGAIVGTARGIKPGETGRLVGWSQMGGTVERLFLDARLSVLGLLRTSVSRCHPPQGAMASYFDDPVPVATHIVQSEHVHYKDLYLRPGDRIIVDYKNTSKDLIVMPWHFAFTVENVNVPVKADDSDLAEFMEPLGIVEDRHVVAAAVRVNRLICMLPSPERHGDILRLMGMTGMEMNTPDIEHGFLLSDGSFATREEAMVIAFDANQLIRQISYVRGEQRGLSTEDVW